MKPAVYEPRGVWDGAAVTYPDAAAVQGDFESFLRHHVVPVVGKSFPAPMEDLDLEVRLPGGGRVVARGRIISAREGSALFRVDPWSEAALAALQAAMEAPPPEARPTTPAPQPEPRSARSAPQPEPRSTRAAPQADARPTTPAPQPEPRPTRPAPEVDARPTTSAPPPPPTARAPAAGSDRAVTRTPPGDPLASLMEAPKRRERESVRLTTPKIEEALSTSLRAASRAAGGAQPSSRTGLRPVHGATPSPPAAEARSSPRGSQAVTPAMPEGAALGASRSGEPAAPPPRLGARAPAAPGDGAARPASMPLSTTISTTDLEAVRPEPGPPPQRRRTDPAFRAVGQEDEIRSLYEARSKGNLFDALGLHFTDAPSRIRAAHHAIVDEYRPGSPAHRRSPTYADLIVKLATQAWSVLSDKGSRRRYRREILSVDCDSAAQILASKSKFAMSRGDLAAARELLEAAADLHPDPEYVEDLRNLLAGKLAPETEESVEIVRPPTRTRTPTR
jgi:hypothetical protein